MCVLVLRAISSRRIDRPGPRSQVSVGLGVRIALRSSGTVEIEIESLLFPFGESLEFIRNPLDHHTQTPQKPEHADESHTQAHRNQTAWPVV